MAVQLRTPPSDDELRVAAEYGMPSHVLMAAKTNAEVLPTRIRSLLSTQVKRLAAETVLSLVFNDANAMNVCVHKDWISQLQHMLCDPQCKYM